MVKLPSGKESIIINIDKNPFFRTLSLGGGLMGLNSDAGMRVPCSTRVSIKSTKPVLKSLVRERKPFGIVLMFPQANQRQAFMCWVFGNVHTD